MTGAWQPTPGAALTDRELQYLRLMADGHTRDSAARAMGITVGGANHHARHVLIKLSAASMAQAVWKGRRLLTRHPPDDTPTTCPTGCAGDRSAYRQHLRRGETACTASRRANAAHTQQYRQNRSTAA
ncbi:response regulator transcription factor [Kitasatospora sp. NPDC057738]|uniref:response regulator transcription factor n=1 Tax=Kitasatospora sp. NPDC057738 TaxID=3346233 RepID=UPI0036C3153F